MRGATRTIIAPVADTLPCFTCKGFISRRGGHVCVWTRVVQARCPHVSSWCVAEARLHRLCIICRLRRLLSVDAHSEIFDTTRFPAPFPPSLSADRRMRLSHRVLVDLCAYRHPSGLMGRWMCRGGGVVIPKGGGGVVMISKEERGVVMIPKGGGGKPCAYTLSGPPPSRHVHAPVV